MPPSSDPTPATTGDSLCTLIFERMALGCAHCRMVYEDDRPVDWRYLAVNPAFERLTGLRDAPGRLVSELIPGIREVNSELLQVYGRVARGGAPESFETFLAGLGLWFAVDVFSPGPEEFVATFSDISERRRIEKRLKLSEEQFRALFELSPDPVTLSRLKDGVILEANRAWCDLAGIPLASSRSLDRLEDTLRSAVGEAVGTSGCAVEIALAPDLPAVSFDPRQMKRVLGSLAANAVEAMGGAGTLRIEGAVSRITESDPQALAAGDYLHLKFVDHGPGIPQAMLPLMFSPYTSSKDRGQQRGMGLSLAIAHSILKLHAGALDAENRSEGGATLHVYLPIPQAE